MGASTLNAGDTAWMLVATAMVVFMIPGLALFYGGLARSKNILATMMHSVVAMGVVMVQWLAFGWSLSFGEGNAFIGGLGEAFLMGITPDTVQGTIPKLLFIAYQGAFACITPALISGSIAERIKFGPYVIFILLWSTLVYNPVCHWVWHSQGWLFKAGVIDFAGGIVVHLTSGIAGLVACLLLGKRHELQKGIIPHNVVFVVMGTGVLWFGWFGFNAGSALTSGGLASLAFLNTFAGPAAGLCTWLILEKWHLGKSSTLGGATGAIAGLATVTPAAGSVMPLEAMLLACITTCVCYFFVSHKNKFGIDDSLDAFGVHGIAGILGPIGCGVFASWGYNSLLHAGSASAQAGSAQFLAQIKAVGAVALWSAAITAILVLALEKTVGFRVKKEDEEQGLDLTVHGERAYN
jgi:ammonium transporter, Amt family